MNVRTTRLWINHNYDSIKHWLFVVIGFTLIVFALLSYANSNHLLKQVNVLAEQNKVLSQQNKKLNEATSLTGDATQKVVLQNRSYIKCLSDIFANYTHNFVPITIDNLDSCTIRTDGTSSSNAVSNQSPAASGPVPLAHSTPSSTNTQSNSSQPQHTVPAQQSGIIQRILNDVNIFN